MTRRAQLRSYVVRKGEMDAFVAAWTGGVVPLRRQYGFAIDGAWLDRETGRFVWVVSHESADAFATSEQAYYGSPERAAMDPDPGSFLVSIETALLDVLEVG